MSRARAPSAPLLSTALLAALGLAGLLLGGCGMYGDLYLEGQAPPPEVTPEDAPRVIPEVTEEPPIMLEEAADENERKPDADQPDADRPDEGTPAGAP